MDVFAELDWETGERAGAGGTFQVSALTDGDDTDLIDHVDVGRHYNSISELERDLAKALGTSVTVHEA